MCASTLPSTRTVVYPVFQASGPSLPPRIAVPSVSRKPWGHADIFSYQTPPLNPNMLLDVPPRLLSISASILYRLSLTLVSCPKHAPMGVVISSSFPLMSFRIFSTTYFILLYSSPPFRHFFHTALSTVAGNLILGEILPRYTGNKRPQELVPSVRVAMSHASERWHVYILVYSIGHENGTSRSTHFVHACPCSFSPSS